MLALIAISDNALRAKVKGQLQSIAEIHQILESSTAEDALFQLLETKPDVLIAFDLLPARNGFHLSGGINDNQLVFLLLSCPIIHCVQLMRSGTMFMIFW